MLKNNFFLSKNSFFLSKNRFVLILVLGILIRLILAATTYHSDLQHFYFAGKVISEGNVANFYDYLGSLPKDNQILKIFPTYLFNYPPAVYFFLGSISYLFSLPFNSELLKRFVFDVPSLLGRFDFNLLLLSLKLPYLAFDLGVAFILAKLFDGLRAKTLAFGFWMLNPLALYATYMMGQFDVISTFLTILALYLAVKKDRLFAAAFFLGLGASFKIFPFLFLLPLSLLRKKWADRLKIIGIGILTYGLTILPFLKSAGFRATALVAGQTTKSLYAVLPISGGEAIILFPLFILFVYFVFLYSKNEAERLWQRFFILLLTFFIFTHYHPQWFLWLTPFLIIDLIKSRFSHWPLAVLSFFGWLVLVTFFDPGLSVWLFSPISPNLYGSPGIWELLGINVDLNFARSLFQTLFASSAAYLIYYHFPKKIEE